jgi:hypothetical protein
MASPLYRFQIDSVTSDSETAKEVRIVEADMRFIWSGKSTL